MCTNGDGMNCGSIFLSRKQTRPQTFSNRKWLAETCNCERPHNGIVVGIEKYPIQRIFCIPVDMKMGYRWCKCFWVHLASKKERASRPVTIEWVDSGCGPSTYSRLLSKANESIS